jgi:hypothetical protein
MDLLFPSFTVRSSGGLGGSLLFEFGMLRSGAEPVNQTSGSAFWPALTVARDLEGLVTGCVGVDLPR